MKNKVIKKLILSPAIVVLTNVISFVMCFLLWPVGFLLSFCSFPLTFNFLHKKDRPIIALFYLLLWLIITGITMPQKTYASERQKLAENQNIYTVVPIDEHHTFITTKRDIILNAYVEKAMHVERHTNGFVIRHSQGQPSIYKAINPTVNLFLKVVEMCNGKGTHYYNSQVSTVVDITLNIYTFNRLDGWKFQCGDKFTAEGYDSLLGFGGPKVRITYKDGKKTILK